MKNIEEKADNSKFGKLVPFQIHLYNLKGFKIINRQLSYEIQGFELDKIIL